MTPSEETKAQHDANLVLCPTCRRVLVMRAELQHECMNCEAARAKRTARAMKAAAK